MALDTLKVARRLREAGFNEAQADAVIAAVQEGAEGGDLATKADLALINARFDALQASIEARFEAVHARIDGLQSSIDARFDAFESSIDARIDARIEAAKSEILFRTFQMILGAVLVNIAAMAGIMFGFAKLLGH